MDIKHLLITRTAVKVKGSRYMDPNWIRKREIIFRGFTLPLVLDAKKPKQFEWIVLVHKKVLDRDIEFLLALHKLGKIRLVRTPGKYIPFLQEFIEREYDNDYILTTRLDNDDGVYPWYFTSIYDKAKIIKEGIINFSHGHKKCDNKLIDMEFDSNGFASRIERKGNVKTE